MKMWNITVTLPSNARMLGDVVENSVITMQFASEDTASAQAKADRLAQSIRNKLDGQPAVTHTFAEVS